MQLSLNFRTSLALILALLSVAAYVQVPEDDLLAQEPRRLDLRRWLHPLAGRRDRERQGADEADAFVRELTEQDHQTQVLLPMPGKRPPGRHRQDPAAVVKTRDLPRFRPTRVLRDPDEPRPPWDDAADPAGDVLPGEDHPDETVPDEKPSRPLDTWAPGDPDDPPTIIRDGVIPAIRDDLMKYLDSLHGLGSDKD